VAVISPVSPPIQILRVLASTAALTLTMLRCPQFYQIACSLVAPNLKRLHRSPNLAAHLPLVDTCRPNARANSSSAKSSSMSMTRCNELNEGWQRPPCRTKSAMNPAFPSKPIALVKRGKSKSSLRPASSSAEEIVCSVLLEMMKSRMPAFRKAHSHGFSKGALLRRSSPL